MIRPLARVALWRGRSPIDLYMAGAISAADYVRLTRRAVRRQLAREAVNAR